MTIPWLMNCGHNGDGWCLDCVKRQHAELEAAEARVAEMEKVLGKLSKKAPIGDYVADLYSELNNSLLIEELDQRAELADEVLKGKEIASVFELNAKCDAYESTLRGVLAVSQRRNTATFNVITDAVRLVLR